MKKIITATLIGRGGLEATICNYGAKIMCLLVPVSATQKRDVVLGYATVDEWLHSEPSLNAVIGRYANRIKGGRFSLDGVDYQLPVNLLDNTLHGGIEGFQQKVWDVVGQSADSISLHYRSLSGEEGFPGTLDVYVTYRLTRDNALRITYEAKTDAPTVINLTNHAYFNLEGESSPSVRGHRLQIHSDEYVVVDNGNCPTGVMAPVEGSPMDFRSPVLIADRIDHPFFAPTAGIDACWRLRTDEAHRLREVAVLQGGELTMRVRTTAPFMQVYTANFIEPHIGRGGTLYSPQNAICLETQNVSDAPNQLCFPSAVLRPGEIYFEQTEYKFD